MTAQPLPPPADPQPPARAERLPDPVPEHPLLRGKKELARGRYSIVLEGESPEAVFKIVTHPDEFLFYTAEDRPQGPHFPVVHAYHGIIGRSTLGYPMHLLSIERLYPLPEQSAAGQLARRLASVYWEICARWGELGQQMGTIILHQMREVTPPLEQSLQEALAALSRFAEQYRLLPDLIRKEQLMMRKDGTLVFVDPLVLRDH